MIKNILLSAVFVCASAFLFSCAHVAAKKNPDGIYVAKAKVADRKIIVTDEKGKKARYIIKGVCYAPDIAGLSYWQHYKTDLSLIKNIGANSIRTYRPLGAYFEDGSLNKTQTLQILDAFLEEGITVAAGFSYEDMRSEGLMEQYLEMFGNHPAILMIVLGNEYNYHYDQWFTKKEWLKKLKLAVKTAKKLAPNKIVATVHGELPSKKEYKKYVKLGLNLVMTNIYRGSNFGFAKDDWYSFAKNMPWVLGEFGRASVDADGSNAQRAQEAALETLIRSMESGYLFMLIDDPAKGSYEKTPGAGMENSFGVYDENRQPKEAVQTVKEEYNKIKGVIY
ncbi:MAG: hypothetical protein LBQ47_04535 [Endomicrobium sp.]|nr:hypothetical protein [Endomicrobium sp.]